MGEFKRCSSLAVSILVFALPLASISDAQSSKKKGAESTPQDTLRIEVRRVPLDIVVTDKNGNPVRGLKKDDFIIKEDKKTQKALTFEYFDGSSNAFVPPRLPPLPPNTFVNVPAAPEQGPLYVLYYDMVNTSQDDQMSAHKQLLDFVDHAKPGTRFALFANIAGLHLIQGFTSDHELLHHAILSKGPGPHLPDVFLYGQNYGLDDAGAVLSSMKFLAEYLNGIPGRKNLLWLSDDFPIPVGPVVTGHNANAAAIGGGFSNSTLQLNDLTYLESKGIKEAYSALEESQVALYPVDLHGVRGGGDALSDYDDQDTIAAATGGHAFHGNNRINELLDKAVDSGASYYSLTYSPTNMKYDGSERHIEVTLEPKREYTLSYRMLYYGVPDDEPQPPNHKTEVLQGRFVAAKTTDNLYANIEHGAPMLHDLLFSAHVSAEGAPVMATADQMLSLEDSPAYFRTRHRNKPLQPLAPVKLQKYRIDYGVIDAQLKSAAKHKGVPAMLEFAVAAYDPDGHLLNSMLNEGLVPPEADPAAKSGAPFHAQQELDVPPGAAWLRLAVRDKLNNRTGTLELALPLKAEPALPTLSKTN
jgi:VWFA-related protein